MPAPDRRSLHHSAGVPATEAGIAHDEDMNTKIQRHEEQALRMAIFAGETSSEPPPSTLFAAFPTSNIRPVTCCILCIFVFSCEDMW